jgi:hypothetical protein
MRRGQHIYLAICSSDKLSTIYDICLMIKAIVFLLIGYHWVTEMNKIETSLFTLYKWLISTLVRLKSRESISCQHTNHQNNIQHRQNHVNKKEEHTALIRCCVKHLRHTQFLNAEDELLLSRHLVVKYLD